MLQYLGRDGGKERGAKGRGSEHTTRLNELILHLTLNIFVLVFSMCEIIRVDLAMLPWEA